MKGDSGVASDEDPFAEFDRKYGKLRSPDGLAVIRSAYEKWIRDGRPALRRPDEPVTWDEVTFVILEAADELRARCSEPPA